MFSQTITKQVIGSNGTTQTSDNITYSYTIGEPVVGLMYNENNQLSNGFHSGLNLNSVQFYTTQLQYSQCNSTLNSLTSPIVADLVEGAEGYRFEVTNGSNVRTYITNGENSFVLSELDGGVTYATTYTIRVAAKYDGIWSPYAASCFVKTPALPLTRVQNEQCDLVLDDFSTLIYANEVMGVSAYRFEVTKPNNSVAVVRVGLTRSFNLNQVSADFGETYSIKVAVLNNGVWGPYGDACNVTTPLPPSTQIQASQCGVQLASKSSTIWADPIVGTTRYRFQVTNGNQVNEFTTSSARYFKLTDLTGSTILDGATYNIKVAVELRGSWRAYGTECFVTTPAPSTKVQTSQCGVTLASLTTIISANSLSNVAAYRFEVTKAGGEVRTYDSNTRQFYLTQLNQGTTFATFATTYSIRVAVRIGASWMPYGESCNVTTPALPTTKLQASYCGRSNVNRSHRLYASTVSGASAYRFRVTNGTSQAEYTTATGTIYWFTMSNVNIPYTTGTTYNVEVAVMSNGTWGPYGQVCTVKTTGTAPTTREIAEELPSKATIFAVKGYPNPYNAYFTLSIDSPSDAMVYVRVFDMTGKLIEVREQAPSALDSLQLGAEWASGVYNVIVLQDDQVKTLRMVKRE
jgi:hypothetical protein